MVVIQVRVTLRLRDFAQERLVAELGLVGAGLDILIQALQVIAIQRLQAATRSVAVEPDCFDCGLRRSNDSALQRGCLVICQGFLLLPDFGCWRGETVEACGRDHDTLLGRHHRTAHIRRRLHDWGRSADSKLSFLAAAATAWAAVAAGAAVVAFRRSLGRCLRQFSEHALARALRGRHTRRELVVMGEH